VLLGIVVGAVCVLFGAASEDIAELDRGCGSMTRIFTSRTLATYAAYNNKSTAKLYASKVPGLDFASWYVGDDA